MHAIAVSNYERLGCRLEILEKKTWYGRKLRKPRVTSCNRTNVLCITLNIIYLKIFNHKHFVIQIYM